MTILNHTSEDLQSKQRSLGYKLGHLEQHMSHING